MTRRTRFIAGILALVAMTFSFAETVLASTCAPMTAPGGSEMAAMMAGDAAAFGHAAMPMEAPASATERGAAPSGTGCMIARHDGRDDERGDEGHCPFGAAVTQGCSAFASLPARSARSQAPPSEAAPEVPSAHSRTDLLLAHALFHPPRA